jgi:hypothetical protein
MTHPALLNATLSVNAQNVKCNVNNWLLPTVKPSVILLSAPSDAQKTCAKRMTALSAKPSATQLTAKLPAFLQSQTALLCVKLPTATGLAKSQPCALSLNVNLLAKSHLVKLQKLMEDAAHVTLTLLTPP